MIIVKTKHVYGILAVSKFKGATDYNGQYCLVTIRKSKYKIAWDYNLNPEEMHEKAIKVAFEKFFEKNHPDKYDLYVTATETGMEGILVRHGTSN